MHAGVAQLVERLLCKQDVGSSSLSSSTTHLLPSSRGLGHCPFTAATGVRIPLGVPFLNIRSNT